MPMGRDERGADGILFLIGLIPIVWAALLAAPYWGDGLPGIIRHLDEIIQNPLSIEICGDTKKCVLIFLCAYGTGFGIYLSGRKNYRHGEEYGSAKWGSVRAVNRKYRNRKFA